MLGNININERIKIKLENRTNKIIFLIVATLILIISSYSTYNISKKIEMKDNLILH